MFVSPDADAHTAEARREAFSALFERCYPRVLRFVRGTGKDAMEAEDITSEVFAVAWNKFDLRDPIDLNWLMGTAINKLRDHDRRARRRRSETIPLSAAVEGAPTGLDPLDVLAVREALAGLTAKDRQVLQLMVQEGYSAHDVGQMLRRSEGSVWTRASRARAQLRKSLRIEDNDE